MPYNPTTIANYFIERYGKAGELTPMKLLKLTYIAYGWYLAITDGKKRLTNEHPIAWDMGPVFPTLYSNIKKNYKKWNITTTILTALTETITEQDKTFLDKIWSIYGKFDGIYLSALTHQDGTPWRSVYSKGCNIPLKDEDIYRHYKGKMATIDG
ncbi:type II toxin-antitoxin system antitoxin SocA domain-containing protein [Flavobacterium sp. WV_118_3]|uniref:Panacea domain-containing protein n=1 Tax=Flavobacterium sp. WV_118_3 TaxID=3151764 RepID=UPI00321A187B